MSDKPTLNTDNSTIAVCAKVAEVLRAKFVGTEKELSKVGSVERYKKRFNSKADIKQTVTSRGCIHIASLKVRNARKESGFKVGMVKFTAFVMTDDQYGKNRDQRAELIAGQVGIYLTEPEFSKALGRMAHKKVESTSWQNLTNSAIDELGIAMWVVEWEQECRLNVPLDTDLMDDFITLNMKAYQGDDSSLESSPLMEANITLEQTSLEEEESNDTDNS